MIAIYSLAESPNLFGYIMIVDFIFLYTNIRIMGNPCIWTLSITIGLYYMDLYLSV